MVRKAVLTVGVAVAAVLLLGVLTRPGAALSYDDLTEEQKAEALQQKEMLSAMFAELEGLTDEDKKAKVASFTPQQQELLKAYFEHQQQAKQQQQTANARLTPEQQQEMIKGLFEKLEGKSYAEQEQLIKKFTAQEKDLFDRYNDYNKKKQDEFTEKRKKELGHCEADEVYPEETKNGDPDLAKPALAKCQRVHIWDEPLGDDGAAALAAAMISQSDKFVALSLDTCDVEADGAVELAKALARCTQMVALDLDSNEVGDAGAGAIALAAKGHPNLNTLGLAHNDIGAAGGEALLKLLRHSYSIVTMPLHGNKNIPKATLAEIEKLLVKNREVAQAKLEAAQNKTTTTTAEVDAAEAELEGVAEIDADSEHDEF